MDVRQIRTYDRVELRLKEYPNVVFRGQFRGIIEDIDHIYYDKNGSAIWVTTNNGFELMTNISDIQDIVVTERYRNDM